MSTVAPPLPFMHVYYLSHPLPLPLSGQPLTHQGRVVVEKLSVLGPIEDVQTLKQLKGHLVQMAISAMPPIMVSSSHLHYFAASHYCQVQHLWLPGD